MTTPNEVVVTPTKPKHVAIIMDGNGRWAQKRGLPRAEGHRKGVDAVRKAVEAARDFDVDTLTLYAFSSENWSRPEAEVTSLMKLLKFYINNDLATLHKNNVRVTIIGCDKGVPADVKPLLDRAQTLTAGNDGTQLVIAFNYGGRDEIARAMQAIASEVAQGALEADAITEDTISSALDTAPWSDPELIIRTSGEMRLSNFMLWQAAYSEFVFLDCFWPDFDKEQFQMALAEFAQRKRRFGGLIEEKTA